MVRIKTIPFNEQALTAAKKASLRQFNILQFIFCQVKMKPMLGKRSILPIGCSSISATPTAAGWISSE